jgi:hypothetical protein
MIHEAPPQLLTRRNYSLIQQKMVDGSGTPAARTTAVCYVDPAAHLDLQFCETARPDLDTSFGSQITQLQCDPQSVDPRVTSTPDAYLLTAYSAIPLGDSIRAFLRASGDKRSPLMGYIAANRPARYAYDMAQEKGRTTEAFEGEVNRLRSMLAGRQHVCVVEQFVRYGKNLKYAAALLSAAGIPHTTAIRGRWYEDAAYEEIHLGKLSSEHATMMTHIGYMAAGQE